ncbi:MAG: hypothetical protein ACFBSC_07225 [Microcoleaceae cyanobacterium]
MKLSSEALLIEAAQVVLSHSADKPDVEQVVSALLACEKATRQRKQTYDFHQLQGRWRLCFITGTRKARNRAGIVLGAGRYLPRWVEIQIAYSVNSNLNKTDSVDALRFTNDTRQERDSEILVGRVENAVKLAGIQFSLQGPTQFWDSKNILAFDFTRLTLEIFGQQLYQGGIRGGVAQEQKFYQSSLREQAFFTYFWVSQQAIAARGRGGGLALWGRLS